MKRTLLLVLAIVVCSFLAGVVSGGVARVVVSVPERGSLVPAPTKFCSASVSISGARNKPYCVEV